MNLSSNLVKLEEGIWGTSDSWPVVQYSYQSVWNQLVKNLPAKQEIQVHSLGEENPLEKGMATYSSILFWRIPWTEKPGELQSTGSQRLRHDWATNTFTCFSLSRRSHSFGPQVASNLCFQLHFQSGRSMKFMVLRLLLPGVTFLRGCLWPLTSQEEACWGRVLDLTAESGPLWFSRVSIVFSMCSSPWDFIWRKTKGFFCLQMTRLKCC